MESHSHGAPSQVHAWWASVAATWLFWSSAGTPPGRRDEAMASSISSTPYGVPGSANVTPAVGAELGAATFEAAADGGLDTSVEADGASPARRQAESASTT